MTPNNKRFTTIVSLLLTLAGLFLLWRLFTLGPLPAEYGRLGMLILWFYRAVIVVFIGLALYVLWALRRGRLQWGSLGLGFGSLLIGAVFLLPLADELYDTYMSSSHIDEFHPYLQLQPPDVSRMGQQDFPTGKRIVFMGGSSTEFRDKTSHQDWPSRVEKILRDSLGAGSVKVYNQGKAWYTTLHTLINYETNIRQFHPDVIVVMQSINDLLHNADFSHLSNGAFREDYGHFLGPLKRVVHGTGLVWHFWGVAKFALWPVHPAPVEQYEFPGLVAYKRNLNTIIDLAGENGTRVVLMSEPFLYRDSMSVEELRSLVMVRFEAIGENRQWTSGTALRGMRAYNDAMREVAAERGVSFIDLEKFVPKSLEYFLDDVHYTDKAYDVVARAVAEEIMQKRIIGEVKGPK